MAAAYITFWLVLGTVETGVWCDRCLVPSRIRVPVYRVNEHGVALHCNLLNCLECGPYASTEDDDPDDDG